jgi:hypothetical protein
VVIDWIQRNTTSVKKGIQWTMFKQLEDLDFGLNINASKTKIMVVNEKISEPITVENQCLENLPWKCHQQ